MYGDETAAKFSCSIFPSTDHIRLDGDEGGVDVWFSTSGSSFITLTAADARAMAAELNRLAADMEPAKAPSPLIPQAAQLLRYLEKRGNVSAWEASHDLQMTSATLARRICDLIENGHPVRRVRRQNKATGRWYTRYFLDQPEVDGGVREAVRRMAEPAPFAVTSEAFRL